MMYECLVVTSIPRWWKASEHFRALSALEPIRSREPSSDLPQLEFPPVWVVLDAADHEVR